MLWLGRRFFEIIPVSSAKVSSNIDVVSVKYWMKICCKVLELKYFPEEHLLLSSGFVRVHLHSEEHRINFIGRII